ncbi:MAG: trigger factor [Firmicutes bacterium]|nr:trigger factor [Bacillota bacterium]
MTAELVSKENNVVKFKLVFTGEEFDAETNKVYMQQRGSITVPGFRKGKAPRSIIEKRYGEGVFFSDAIDNLINDAYPKALDELDIDPVSRPSVDFEEEKIEKGKGFTAVVSVTVAPAVVPKDYFGIEAERRIRKIGEMDVDMKLAEEQRKNSRLVVSDKAAALGDTVILDYAGFVGEEQFEGGTAENQTLKLGSGSFIPGFEDQLVGVSAGEKKDVNVTFPEKYHAENLAGKDAVFHCTVHEVKTEEVPELNDDFAKDYSEFETLEEFKADIKKKLEENAKDAAEYDGKNAVVAKLLELNPFDIPQVMIDNEAENMLEEMKQNMQAQGVTMEMYTQILGKTEDDLKNDMKADAEKRVKTSLLIKAIADAENVEATEEEVEKELSSMAEMYGMPLEDLRKYLTGQMSGVKQDIRSRKVVDMLYDKAVFTDVEDAPAAAAGEEKENTEETSEQ